MFIDIIFCCLCIESNNRYVDLPGSNRSFLADAKAVLDQNGSLSEAALLLEAAIQQGQLGDGGYEAWILLGETRNMDEREELGMRALVEGVKRAETAGAAGAGQLVGQFMQHIGMVLIHILYQSLAISYTNESFERASYSTLLRWMRARFPSQHIPEETANAVRNNSTWDAHNRVTEIFLNLARTQHSQGILDPEVQIGLGILFYTNAEFDRAKDCFESALSTRPKVCNNPQSWYKISSRSLMQDYLLWNRLGSSLSNGNKPEEALSAYREALSLHPTYTRAIYNVGVACMFSHLCNSDIFNNDGRRFEYRCSQRGSRALPECTENATVE
jgi:peroxin-5